MAGGVTSALGGRYYVKNSGNIQAGDTLWDHGPGKNNNTNASREVDPDTGNRSRQMIGTANQSLGGDRIIVRGNDLVIDATSKGPILPGTVVGTAHLNAGAAGVIPAANIAPAGVPSNRGISPPAPAPVSDVPTGPADSLIGDALTRDPETGKPIKKPYQGDSWENYKRDDFWDMLADAGRGG